jgi:3-hydroxypropanoate dehydrogenase
MTTPLNDTALDQTFRNARTIGYYTSQPVPESTLHAIYDLLKWGPTSANQSPLRIVWCTTPEAKARLAACASKNNETKILNAPVTAILAMDLNFADHLPRLYPHADARSWFAGNQPLIEESAFRNSTLQGAYFIIAARMLGLDTNPMSGFDKEKLNAAFFAGTALRVNFICTLGYGDPAKIHPRNPRLTFEEANTIL